MNKEGLLEVANLFQSTDFVNDDIFVRFSTDIGMRVSGVREKMVLIAYRHVDNISLDP